MVTFGAILFGVICVAIGAKGFEAVSVASPKLADGPRYRYLAMALFCCFLVVCQGGVIIGYALSGEFL